MKNDDIDVVLIEELAEEIMREMIPKLKELFGYQTVELLKAMEYAIANKAKAHPENKYADVLSLLEAKQWAT